MFDVGFWELVMVGVVALVVIGPKDLPRVARIAGLWLGRARRTLASVKEEIDREFKAQELKDILEKQARSDPLQSILEPRRTPAQSEVRPQTTAALAPARPELSKAPAVDGQSAPARETPDR